ncbi:MAG: FeoA family protein [Bryobacteraceae bacterium]
MSLADLRLGEQGILDRIDLPADETLRFMEVGFLPGTTVVAARSAPGGDPRVYQVDGSEFAVRRETASRLILLEEPSLPEVL